MQSGCWVPLIHRGEAIGTLAVASRLEAAFSQREAEMLVADRRPGGHGRQQRHGLPPDCRNCATGFGQEKQYLEEEINLENRFDDIVGESTGLRQVLKRD